MGLPQDKGPGIPQGESIGLESIHLTIFARTQDFGFVKSQNMRPRHFFFVLLFWLALPLTSFTGAETHEGAHKFYVSVTTVDYAQKEEALQIISRIFIDDLESALMARYDIKADLGTPAESGEGIAYIERYFNSKFSVFVNGEVRKYTFLGRKYDRDQVICYLEVSGIPQAGLESVGVQNEILMDVFEEQKNLVHLRILGAKKSYVLIRENNKGMLNL